MHVTYLWSAEYTDWSWYNSLFSCEWVRSARNSITSSKSSSVMSPGARIDIASSENSTSMPDFTHPGKKMQIFSIVTTFWNKQQQLTLRVKGMKGKVQEPRKLNREPGLLLTTIHNAMAAGPILNVIYGGLLIVRYLWKMLASCQHTNRL